MKFNVRKLFPVSSFSGSIFDRTLSLKRALFANSADNALRAKGYPKSRTEINVSRRQLISGLVAGAGLATLSSSVVAASESADAVANDKGENLRFPGDPAEHKVVYQFNKADEQYQKAVLFSVGAMLRKYGDNIDIVVVGIGPGIHILAKKPDRPVSDTIKERVSSLMQYGVKFHACGNTMKALKWEKENIIDGVPIVEVGAADLMELQAQGYSYISW